MLQRGGQNQTWPTSGPGGFTTLAIWRAPILQSRGQNQKWPTSGRSDYTTHAVLGFQNALERRTKSELGHNWAMRLHNPCRLGGPRCFTAGDKVRSGQQVGSVPA